MSWFCFRRRRTFVASVLFRQKRFNFLLCEFSLLVSGAGSVRAVDCAESTRTIRLEGALPSLGMSKVKRMVRKETQHDRSCLKVLFKPSAIYAPS